MAPVMGVRVLFASGESVLDLDVSQVVLAEHVGDHVQVCFLGRVARSAPCMLAVDHHGRRFRVYDYRLKAAYTVSNNSHIRGGA